MNTSPEKEQISKHQVSYILNDIAQKARLIERFSVMLQHVEDERDIDALTIGIESAAQRIGLLADMAADSLPGLGATYGTTIESWMMPPSYHDYPHRPTPWVK